MEMKELVKRLNEASDVYYNSGAEVMSDKQYDELYDQLVKMETESGVILSESPTQRAGYAVVSELPEEKHEVPALSLAKTKDIEEFPKEFNVYNEHAVIMWKMDGSTLQATYDKGKLTRVLTRGNGEVGSNVTHNAPFIHGLPLEIPCKEHLVVRGELCMSYKEFKRINEALSEEEQYKNPRNLANATVRLLDSKEVSQREVWFHAFDLFFEDESISTRKEQFIFLKGQGFNVVEYVETQAQDLVSQMNKMSERVTEFPFPVDGLVVATSLFKPARALQGTGHNPHKLVGYAFKWTDKSVETILRKIEWSASRTGLLNPVAVFDPVELEGTTVTRASLHNVSYIMKMNLQVEDKVTVYKANMIIPSLGENLSKDEHPQVTENDFIHVCPICGFQTDIATSKIKGSLTKTMWCKNPGCAAKSVGKFVHFCERDCMDIKGTSMATIQRFVELGFIKEFADFFKLDRFESEIVTMEGFGRKSYDNIINTCEEARKTSFVPFIHALGIPGIGKGQAKLFNKEYKGDVSKFFDDVSAGKDFTYIDGIGSVLSNNLIEWGREYLSSAHLTASNREVMNLLAYMIFPAKEQENDRANNVLEGKTFVITGSLNHYSNRDELISVIESLGGKSSGSVSAKTTYLINNDTNSSSGKNKKAKELGVSIISEEDFIEIILNK